MTELKGLIITEDVVRSEWIDVNEHMNVANYVLVFDKAADEFWSRLGLTEQYIKSGAGTFFNVEFHVTYQRELREGDSYQVTSEILAYDDKRLHHFQRIYHVKEKFLSATAEWMTLHVDPATRRVSPWPDFALRALAEFAGHQKTSGAPPEAGNKLQIAKPIWAMQSSSAGG